MWFTEHPPIDISREAAADAARRELSRYIYANEEPNLLWRAISWLRDRLADLAITLGDAVPIGRWALLILPLLVVIALAVIRWRVGPVAATRAVTGPVFGPAVRTAAEHRAAAEEAAARGDFATACRERFRALVKDLEERTILDPRPGRTADETAREVAAVSPDAAGPVTTAARRFDEVQYGARPASADDYAAIGAADDAVRLLRPSVPL